MKKNRLIALSALFGLTSFTGIGLLNADACTRIVYAGDDSLYIVGRSLDWKTPIPTNLYVYPRGVHKTSSDQPGAIEWTSKYGAIYAVGYDGGITEGMNEKGLVINGLFCKGAVYNSSDAKKHPPMSLAMFVGWLLDMNATTQDVIDVLKLHNFSISGATFDGGTVSSLHWGITDAAGQTAILEFDNGNIRIYEGDGTRTLTNDPAWPSMQAINNYWKGIGGHNMMPGTVKSPDRFVRADYFINHVKPTSDGTLGVAITRSVLGCSSVPFTYTVEGEPNISSTQWRSFANIRDRQYYFDLVTNMGMYYIDLKKCNLNQGAPVMKLDTSMHPDYAGDATKLLVRSKPFVPMY